MENPLAKKKLPYPRYHSLSIMGYNQADFLEMLASVLAGLKISYKDSETKKKISAQGAYLSLTLSLWIEEKAQLEKLYVELKKSHLVKFIL